MPLKHCQWQRNQHAITICTNTGNSPHPTLRGQGDMLVVCQSAGRSQVTAALQTNSQYNNCLSLCSRTSFLYIVHCTNKNSHLQKSTFTIMIPDAGPSFAKWHKGKISLSRFTEQTHTNLCRGNYPLCSQDFLLPAGAFVCTKLWTNSCSICSELNKQNCLNFEEPILDKKVIWLNTNTMTKSLVSYCSCNCYMLFCARNLGFLP